MVARHLLILLTVLGLAAGARAETVRVRAAAVPEWVNPVAVPPPSPASELDTDTLLIDQQEHVETGFSACYEHIAYVVRSASGVQNSSEISILRSSDETLAWHFVRLQRAGKSRELLPELKIKIFQPEEQNEGGIYDGARREVIILEDVRPGDVIEYAYSKRVSAAVLDGRYVSRRWFGRPYPVKRLHFAASWPADRKIRVRAVGGSVERPTESSVRFLRDEVPAYRDESREPSWFEDTPRIDLSEFANWAEVVAWALPRYQPGSAAPVETLARELKTQGNLEASVTQAVRFVQDDVRYLGLEEGERALVPHAPEQVLARRFGDCKDKTLLLVALLRTLGVAAEPALVSARWEIGVADTLPSTLAFDHAVVRASLGGKELWIDPTRNFQRGPATDLTGLPFGRALLVRTGETGLSIVPVRRAAGPQVSVEEHFGISSSGSAELEVATKYLGEEADHMRGRLAQSELTELQKWYLDFYGKNYGTIRVVAPLTIHDDPERNEIILNEHYTVTKFWQSGQRTVTAWSLLDGLPVPEASREQKPFALPHPMHVRHVIELSYGEGWTTEPEREKFDSPELTYVYSSHHEGVRELIEHELVLKTGYVKAAGLDAYVDVATKARDRVDSTYVSADGPPVAAPSKRDAISSLWAFVTVLAVLGLAVLVAVAIEFLGRKRARAFQQKKRFAPGEAPISAIEVRSVRHAQDELRRVRCCETAPFTDARLVPQEVLYGKARVLAYRSKCGSCRRSLARYFSLRESGSGEPEDAGRSM